MDSQKKQSPAIKWLLDMDTSEFDSSSCSDFDCDFSEPASGHAFFPNAHVHFFTAPSTYREFERIILDNGIASVSNGTTLFQNVSGMCITDLQKQVQALINLFNSNDLGVKIWMKPCCYGTYDFSCGCEGHYVVLPSSEIPEQARQQGGIFACGFGFDLVEEESWDYTYPQKDSRFKKSSGRKVIRNNRRQRLADAGVTKKGTPNKRGKRIL